jgi:hypothetical protein
VLGEDDRTVRRGQAGGVEEVFDGQSDAVADPLGPAKEDPVVAVNPGPGR